jgi:hypothetical protein
LPGYPASHGCVRLPKEFSALLYIRHACRHDGDHNQRPCRTANPGKPLGSHLFVLMGTGTYGQGLLWQVISHNATPGGVVSGAHDELIQRISGEPSVVHAMKAGHEPGHGACPDRRADHGENRSGAGFSIITADER